jgi:hypothetical protein
MNLKGTEGNESTDYEYCVNLTIILISSNNEVSTSVSYYNNEVNSQHVCLLIQGVRLRPNNTWIFVGLFLFIHVVTFIGCSEQHPQFGKWQTKPETHEYVLLTAKDAKTLGEIPPRDEQDWVQVKEYGKPPENIKSSLKSHAVTVVESGFTFLASTKETGKNQDHEVFEWGYKLVLENRSKRSIHAYGGYVLFDKDGFELTRTNFDWDKGSEVLIKPGGRSVIKRQSFWQIDKATKPYPPSRVVGGDYKLFLRHDPIHVVLEEINEENITNNNR